MSDFLLLLLAFLAVVNPAAVAVSSAGVEAEWRRRVAMALAAGGIALVVAAALAAGAEDVVNWLDIEPETFRIAAGVVFIVAGARMVVLGPYEFERGLKGWWAVAVPLAFPVMVTPELAAAALAYGEKDGAGDTAWAAAIALTVAAALTAVPGVRQGAQRVAFSGAARALGALLIVFAARLVVDGIRAI